LAQSADLDSVSGDETREKADAKAADRHEFLLFFAPRTKDLRPEAGGSVVRRAHLKEMVPHNFFAHAHALVVESHPLIAILIDPVMHLDRLGLEVVVTLRSLDKAAMSGGVEGVLEQFPNEDIRIPIEVLPH